MSLSNNFFLLHFVTARTVLHILLEHLRLYIQKIEPSVQIKPTTHSFLNDNKPTTHSFLYEKIQPKIASCTKINQPHIAYCMKTNQQHIVYCTKTNQPHIAYCTTTNQPHKAYCTKTNQPHIAYCMFMVFNATFNDISVISWWSVLSIEKTGESGEKPPTCRNH